MRCRHSITHHNDHQVTFLCGNACEAAVVTRVYFVIVRKMVHAYIYIAMTVANCYKGILKPIHIRFYSSLL